MRLAALARLADRVIGGPSLSPPAVRRFHAAVGRVGSEPESRVDVAGDTIARRREPRRVQERR